MSQARSRQGEIEAHITALQQAVDRGCGAIPSADRRHLRDLCLVIAGKLDPDAPPRTDANGAIRPWGSQDE